VFAYANTGLVKVNIHFSNQDASLTKLPFSWYRQNCCSIGCILHSGKDCNWADSIITHIQMAKHRCECQFRSADLRTYINGLMSNEETHHIYDKQADIHACPDSSNTGTNEILPSNTDQSAFLPFRLKLFLSQIETSVKKKEVPTALLLNWHGCNWVRLSQATELSLNKNNAFSTYWRKKDIWKNRTQMGEYYQN